MIRNKALWSTAVLCGGHAWTLAAAPVFSMYCYWTGEATVGKVPGVGRTRIRGFGGNEVVAVPYDLARTDVGWLAETLKRQESF
jgi:hypothetical protein